MATQVRKLRSVEQAKKVNPSSLLDPNFKYVSAAATDITQTWRRFGWTPIEKKEKFYAQTPEAPQSYKP